MQPPRHLDPSMLKQAPPLKPYLDNYMSHNSPDMQKDALGSFSNFPLSMLAIPLMFQNYICIFISNICLWYGFNVEFLELCWFLFNFVIYLLSLFSVFLHLFHQAWTLTWMYPWIWVVVAVVDLWATKSRLSPNWRNFGLLTLWSRTANLVNKNSLSFSKFSWSCNFRNIVASSVVLTTTVFPSNIQTH